MLVEPRYFKDQSPFNDDLSVSFFCSHMQYSEVIWGFKDLQKKHDPIKAVMSLSHLA